MKPGKLDKESADPFSRAGLVQFRADPVLMQGLNQIAEKFHLSVGTLARLWVAERLIKETSHDVADLEQWRLRRYSEIEKTVQAEFNPGPVLVMHLVPFSKYIDIDPSSIKQFARLLPPVERNQGFSAQINLEGLRTEKRYLSEEAIAGYVQVFREGPIESVREIMTDENNGIIGELFDEEFITALWSYSCALEALGIQLP
ncbi:MAG: putative DNA-binding protein, partial [Cyanobacteriota bacterium erpe_2018_sw_21hr_WHONDRS-SW48-000092_B_bin.40]|nr:putative DNA-binding protein [Cyanobacteriota bacterium erpe_2018_sw_21hr_WHONDRS-SW48-000092_B_bin.40]